MKMKEEKSQSIKKEPNTLLDAKELLEMSNDDIRFYAYKIKVDKEK